MQCICNQLLNTIPCKCLIIIYGCVSFLLLDSNGVLVDKRNYHVTYRHTHDLNLIFENRFAFECYCIGATLKITNQSLCVSHPLNFLTKRKCKFWNNNTHILQNTRPQIINNLTIVRMFAVAVHTNTASTISIRNGCNNSPNGDKQTGARV